MCPATPEYTRFVSSAYSLPLPAKLKQAKFFLISSVIYEQDNKTIWLQKEGLMDSCMHESTSEQVLTT